MENYVPNLEHCKRLKEAGWVKETYFVWRIPVVGKPHVTPWKWHKEECEGQCGEFYLAPLLSELLDESPQHISTENDNSKLIILKVPISNPNLCNAAADLWVWLKENHETQ